VRQPGHRCRGKLTETQCRERASDHRTQDDKVDGPIVGMARSVCGLAESVLEQRRTITYIVALRDTISRAKSRMVVVIVGCLTRHLRFMQ
jgi:hypothetical protein